MDEMILEARHVSYAYDDGHTPSLNDLSLSVKKGSRTVFMGANGSGKSTFFLCCNGILRPDAGQISIAGKPIVYKRKELLKLRRKVGIVFQNPDVQLLSASVYQEIAFGPLNLGLTEAEARARVEDMIARMGITPFKDRPAHALSGGQKKQVALADILVMAPDILILDEPFAALDPGHVRTLRALTDHLSDTGMTVIVATHDVDHALEWADDLILMKEGRVVAQGEPIRLLSDERVLEKADIHMPEVLKLYRKLIGKGLIDAALPAPKSFDELERYIERKA